MKKKYFFTLLLTLMMSGFTFGQTSLTAGDLVVIQLQTDAPDAFRFVPLVDLESGTIIKFTENGWTGTALNSNESTIIFTADAAIAKGTNIYWDADSTDARFNVEGNLGFSASGDQLLVYQGDAASPTFIFAVQSNSTVWQTSSSDTNQSDLPQGLTNGLNAVAAGAGSGVESEYDNIYYNGITTGSKTALLAAVANAGNWVGDNTIGYTPISDDFTITAESTEPTITILTPSNNSVFPSSISQVTVNLSVANFILSADNGSGTSDNSGDGYIKGTLEVQGGATDVSSFFSTTVPAIEVVPGAIYNLTLELVDNAGASLTNPVMKSVTFNVELPCDIQLDSYVTTCDAETIESDTYNVSIPFTGGNTSTYTLTTNFGTIAGDDPSTSASGTIIITGIAEGTNVAFKLKGDISNSNCDITRNISSPTCVPAPTCPEIGSLIVTEVMQNPGEVSDANGEYFEIYNTTASPIDMQGWLIKSLTTSSKDHIIASSLVVPANGYVVLGINSDSLTNGGVSVDYQYGSNFFLGNSSDSIALECGANVVDSISWDNGDTFPDPTGKSMELATNKYTATDNDTGANWAEATSEIVSDGDLGTPGFANDFVLSIDREGVLGFATYPNPITDKIFTITSNSSEQKNITIFNVLGKKVFTTKFSATNEAINVSSINSGIYILKVSENGKTATKKLVIQ